MLLFYYISHFETWNATPRNNMKLLILVADARQHGGVSQGVDLRKAARTDARALFDGST
jgi:hypothetical protein